MELLDSVDDSDPLAFHLSSVIHDNDASNSEIQQRESLPDKEWLLASMISTKAPPKDDTSATSTHHHHSVKIYLGFIRLKNVNTDLVVTYNIPQVRNEQNDHKHAFLNILNSIVIKEYSLFA